VLTRSTPIDVLFVNWRDLSHPEGGGSERYVHRMAEGLAATGLSVTMFCAAHDRAPADELVGGVRMVRRGGRRSVYLRALGYVATHRPRLVVDVQNGLPFGSTLATRAPVVVLVHHVHREQWPIVFGRLGGAVGWWLESVVAPLLYRKSRYVTVSQATADELVGLGIDAARITVVPNGIEPAPAVRSARSPEPRLAILGRLVPHKRVEHAFEVLARLQGSRPGLRLSVIGEGWWEPELRSAAQQLGVEGLVDFHGFLGEEDKHDELARAWVHLCPSVKEGWGLVVSEAGSHEVPTVGYRSAGGLRESVLDGRTGLLVDDLPELTAAVERLLDDEGLRTRMGAEARRHAADYSWPASVRSFARVLSAVAEGSAVGAVGQDVRGGGAAAGLAVGDRGIVAGGDGVRGRGGLDADDRDHADGGADGERGQGAGERLHAGTHFRRERRRSAKVDARTKIHNAAPATSPSADA
jgi:glycosyltransferase involved in cell wall biosynthesis